MLSAKIYEHILSLKSFISDHKMDKYFIFSQLLYLWSSIFNLIESHAVKV